VANGVVYVGSDDHNLYAFDAAGNISCSGSPKTCAPLWTAATGGAVLSSPAVVNGVVYVGSADGKLYAFDAAGNISCSGSPKTCAPLWTAATGGAVLSSPAVVNNVVYVGSNDTNLYAFDASGNTTNCSGSPKTCAPLWTAATGVVAGYAPNWVVTSPAVANGVVYVGSQETDCNNLFCLALNFLVAFDARGNINCLGAPKTCGPLWTSNVTIGQAASPAVANGTVYVGSADYAGPVLADYDAAGSAGCSGTPKTCTPLWTASVWNGTDVSSNTSSPAVANGVVYISSGGHTLYAVDAASHIRLWATDTGGSVSLSPAIANGVVYVGSSTGIFLALNATTGAQLWSGATGGPINSSPAVANGMVYVGSDDGAVHAYGLP
jgi:outer membrane protein assembly factor BamB